MQTYINVIASEAKQSILSLCCAMDCFASLAMTVLTARAGARSMTGSAKQSGVGAAKCDFHPCTTDFAIMQ
jgi:hypothetical protein